MKDQNSTALLHRKSDGKTIRLNSFRLRKNCARENLPDEDRLLRCVPRPHGRMCLWEMHRFGQERSLLRRLPVLVVILLDK